MSLLTQPFAVPSRVKGAIALIAQEKSQRIKRDVAEALLSPQSLKSEETDGDKLAMVRRTLDECVRTGIVIEDGESLVLNERFSSELRTLNEIDANLPHVMLEALICGINSENEDLLPPLAWFLSQDVLNPPKTWGEFANALTQQGLGEVLKFNDTRYANFSYWARYLGLATIVGSPAIGGSIEERLFPDATKAYRYILHQVLDSSGGQIQARECLRRVGLRYPIFETGAVRNIVEGHAPTREPDHASTATSMALLRLEAEKCIRLEQLSDADAVILVEGTNRRSISQITWVAT